MTGELHESDKRFNHFSFVVVVAGLILSNGLPIDQNCLAALPLRLLSRVEIDAPDSLSQLRADIDAGISGEIGVDDFEELAGRTMDLAEGNNDQSELLSILRQASRLCWNGPVRQSRVLRDWSMNQLVAMSAESGRARTMLRSQFLPSLHRVVSGEQLDEVGAFDHLVDELISEECPEEFCADLSYAKSLLRVEVNRAWNAVWLDQVERDRTIDSLRKLDTAYGKVEASGGKTYSEIVAGDIRELRELAFGAPAPGFTLTDLHGVDLELKDYRGKVVALIFWSSWCAPCLAQVPEEKEMQSGFAGEPFELIGVNSDQTAENGLQTAAQREMTWRNVWDREGSDSSLGQHFAIRGLPSAIVIDREGRICGKFVGSIFNQNFSTSDVKRVVEMALGKQKDNDTKVADNFGFTRKEEGAADEPKKNSDADANEETLTAEELNRYTIVAKKLITAINNEDKQAYRALFTDQAWESAIPWFREMFSAQISSFGRIEKAYAPRRGLVRISEKMSFRGGTDQSATVMVKFEEAIGGALSFELNDENKIISSNVFIKKELADFVDKTAAPIFELK